LKKLELLVAQPTKIDQNQFLAKFFNIFE